MPSKEVITFWLDMGAPTAVSFLACILLYPTRVARRVKSQENRQARAGRWRFTSAFPSYFDGYVRCIQDAPNRFAQKLAAGPPRASVQSVGRSGLVPGATLKKICDASSSA